MRLRRKKGFTLIELIVVLVILAILVAAALPAMMGYVERARAAQHYAEMRAAVVSSKVALELVNAAKGSAYVEYLSYPVPSLDTEIGQDKLFASYIEENLDSELCDRISVYVGFTQASGVTSISLMIITVYFGEGRTGAKLVYQEGPNSVKPGQILYYDKNGNPVDL